MKLIKVLLLWLAIGLSAFAQQVNVTANKLKGSATAPSGACSGQSVFLTTAGALWVCQSGTWASVSAPAGTVIGPGSATDNAVVRFDSTTGALVQNSVVLIGDTGNVTGVGTLASGAQTITSAANPCWQVGPNGATNPTLAVKCDVASAISGILVTGNATGAGVDIAATGGTNESIRITPKGTGGVHFPSGAVATPGIAFTVEPTLGFRRAGVGSVLFGSNTSSIYMDKDATLMLNSAASAAVLAWSANPGVSAVNLVLARKADGVLRIGANLTDGGSLLLGTSTVGAIGTSGVNVLAIANGTAPSSSPADEFQLYSADSAAGDANAFTRNEAGEINRLTGLAARNSAQFDKTSDTTLANVTGLTRNVEASRTYAFTAIIRTTAVATGGVKLAISGTATATAISYEGVLMSGAAIVAQTGATALNTAVCESTTTTAGTCTIRGVIQVNAGGTLTVQFAQNASDGTASSVLANQYFQLIPIS